MFLKCTCLCLFLAMVVDAGPCDPTGEWSEWSGWTACPQSGSSLMNFQRRIKQCEARPVGCSVTIAYTCPGNYSEVRYCTTTTVTTTPIPTTEGVKTTEPTTEGAEPTTEANEPATEATEETTVASEPTTEAAEATTVATTEATIATSAVTEPATEGATPAWSDVTIGELITTMASTVEDIAETEAEEVSESPTTAKSSVTCDDCPELNVHLYEFDPFEDATSVVNRYSVRGCKYVEYFCRSSEKNDTRPVRTIYDGEVNVKNLPVYSLFACQNGLWIEQQLQDPVSSLSCVYDPPPTTTTPTTTTLDPNDPCFNCSYLVVSPPQSVKEGYTYLDHRIDNCLSVRVCCRPLDAGGRVDLLIDDMSFGLTGTSVNRTFYCNHDQRWVDQETDEIVDSVACAVVSEEMEESSTSGLMTTTALIEGETDEVTGEAEETTEPSLVETTTVEASETTESGAETSPASEGESTIGEIETTLGPIDWTDEGESGEVTGEAQETTAAEIETTLGPIDWTEGEEETTGEVTGESGETSMTPGEIETTLGPIDWTDDEGESTGEVTNAAGEESTTVAIETTLGDIDWFETTAGEETTEASETDTTLSGAETTTEETVVETTLETSDETEGLGETSVGSTPGEIETTIETEETTEGGGDDSGESGEETTPDDIFQGSTTPGGITIEPETAESEAQGETTAAGVSEESPTTLANEVSTTEAGSTDEGILTTLDTSETSAETVGSQDSTVPQTVPPTTAGGDTTDEITFGEAESSTPAIVTEGNSETAEETTLSGVVQTTTIESDTTDDTTNANEESSTPKAATGQASTTSAETVGLEETTLSEVGDTTTVVDITDDVTNEAAESSTSNVVTDVTGGLPGQSSTTPAFGETDGESETDLPTPAIDQTPASVPQTIGPEITTTSATESTPGLDPGEVETDPPTEGSSSTATSTLPTAGATTTTTTMQPLITTILIPTITTGIPTVVSTTQTPSVPGVDTTTTTTVSTTGTIALDPGAVTTTSTASSGVTVTSPVPNAFCGHCPNMDPVPVPSDGLAYNGMIVLDHYTNTSGCRTLDIYCIPNPGDNATILFSDGSVAAAGPGEQKFSLECTTSNTWVFNGNTVTSATCSANGLPSELKTTTLAPSIPPTTTEPTTTTRIPGVAVCKQCGRLPVNPVTDLEYTNGFTTLVSDEDGECYTMQLTCAATNPADAIMILMGGTMLTEGVGKITFNMTCNDLAMWTTPSGIVVPEVSCGIPPASTTTSTTTTTTTTTSTTTTTTTSTTTELLTTTTPTLCGKCPNMEATEPPSLASNQDTGMLVLDHFYEFPSNCRVVVVRCKGSTEHDNMTIIFDGIAETPTTPWQVSTSLICSPDGTWRRLGQQITKVACRATLPPPDVTFPPTVPTVPTTPIPTTLPPGVTIAPCERCTPGPLTAVPSGFRSGFLTIDASNEPQTCLSVQMSCAAPTPGDNVALFSSTGQFISYGVSRVNLTVTCNNQSQWITTEGLVLDSVSCGVLAAPTTPTTVTPALDPQTTPTTAPAAPDCKQSTWFEWDAWSECTDTCGACGTHQRFRKCNKVDPSCLCEGSVYEKEPCGLDVCKYPRESSCCGEFRPKSSGGKFLCVKDTTLVTQTP